MNALLKLVSQYWHHDEQVAEAANDAQPQAPRIGEYHADYSPISAAEIGAPDPQLDAFLKESRPVSR